MKTKEQEEIIDKQIERFEDEILVLRGCIATLQSQKLIDEIRDLKDG